MYYRYVLNEKTKKVQGIYCPEFLHISDGPKWLIAKKRWRRDQRFYEVHDLITDEITYRIPIEIHILTGIPKKTLGRYLSERNAPLLNDRYVVKRIPRVLFMKRSKRYYNEQYFYANIY